MYISYEVRLKEWNRRYGNVGVRLLKMPLDKLVVFLGLNQMRSGKLQTLETLAKTSRAAIKRINPELLSILNRTGLIPLPTTREGKITLDDWQEMLNINGRPVTTLMDLYIDYIIRRTNCSLPYKIYNGYFLIYNPLLKLIVNELSSFDSEALGFILERRKVRRAICFTGITEDYIVHDVITSVSQVIDIPASKVGISGKKAYAKKIPR